MCLSTPTTLEKKYNTGCNIMLCLQCFANQRRRPVLRPQFTFGTRSDYDGLGSSRKVLAATPRSANFGFGSLLVLLVFSRGLDVRFQALCCGHFNNRVWDERDATTPRDLPRQYGGSRWRRLCRWKLFFASIPHGRNHASDRTHREKEHDARDYEALRESAALLRRIPTNATIPTAIPIIIV